MVSMANVNVLIVLLGACLLCTEISGHGYGVTCPTDPLVAVAGEPVTVVMEIFPYDYPTERISWDEIVEHHGSKMSIAVVSHQMNYVDLFHMEDTPVAPSGNDTLFNLTFTPPHEGYYFIQMSVLVPNSYAEIDREIENFNGWCLVRVGTFVEPYLQPNFSVERTFQPISVPGDGMIGPIVPADMETGTGNGITVTLTVNGGQKVLPDECVSLVFTYVDEATGLPITNLKTFDGAAAQVIIVDEEMRYMGSGRVMLAKFAQILNSPSETAQLMNCTLLPAYQESIPPTSFGPTYMTSVSFIREARFFVYSLAKLDDDRIVFSQFQVGTGNTVTIVPTGEPTQEESHASTLLPGLLIALTSLSWMQ